MLADRGGAARAAQARRDRQVFPQRPCRPLIETPDAWLLHGFSYTNYLRELGRNAQSEVFKRSSLSRALRSAVRATRKFLMERYGLDEDEAISLMSVAVDFGVTQVADGNWGVHARVAKAILEPAER
ncbi:hypothetical protein ACFSKM_26345 [Ancylobacter dichloromethanicus]